LSVPQPFLALRRTLRVIESNIAARPRAEVVLVLCKRLSFVLALVCALAAARADASMMVKPMTLDEVTAEARHVVHAVVTDVASGRDEHGVPATWTTFAVVDTMKGPHEPALTIKQYGVAEPLADGTILRLAGVPTYTVGEEVVLFLRGTSPSGFTSPVGLGQGAYRVKRRHDGGADVRSDADTHVPRELQTFLDDVKTRVRAHGEGR
jgi:hypothetical protein